MTVKKKKAKPESEDATAKMREAFIKLMEGKPVPVVYGALLHTLVEFVRTTHQEGAERLVYEMMFKLALVKKEPAA